MYLVKGKLTTNQSIMILTYTQVMITINLLITLYCVNI